MTKKKELEMIENLKKINDFFFQKQVFFVKAS
jgi:hypothetical protein